MDAEQIVTFLEQHGVRKVRLAGADLDGVLRGKFVSLAKLASAARHGFGFCDVIFGWDCADACYDFPTVTGWDTGYPDVTARVDLETMRIVPWEPGTACFVIDFWQAPDIPHPVCPRNLLKRVVAKAGTLGFRPRAAIEYEFWIFRETPETLQEKGFRCLTPVSPGQFGYSILRAGENGRLIHDIMDACEGMHIGLEGLHTETGPGVYEAAIAVEDALEAADQAALFKTTVKEVASRHGCVATFMAKWSADQPGSGGHIHQSLWSADGTESRFHDPGAELGIPALERHYVGGQIALMRDVMVMSCPTVNSYRRTVPGAWAPTSATWGMENRTAAVRAIPGLSSSAARVEYRLPGADANPYLALAAALATGLFGVERGIESPLPVAGNAYQAAAPLLPATLEEATAAFRESGVTRDLFGAVFVDHYAATRDWEVSRARRAVTDWELQRYFEVI